MGLAWPCRDKKTFLPNLEEELMMEAWHLLKNNKEHLLPLPTFHLIINQIITPLTPFLDAVSSCQPACKLYKHPILINHILSIILLLTEFFPCWDIKDCGTRAPWSSQNATKCFPILLRVFIIWVFFFLSNLLLVFSDNCFTCKIYFWCIHGERQVPCLYFLPSSSFLTIQYFKIDLLNHSIWNYAFDTPLQYSCLENPMDGGALKAVVCGVAEGQTRLSDFTFTFHFHALEKEMATHSSILAWRIPGMGGAWWAAVYGVTHSRTWLMWLSSSSILSLVEVQLCFSLSTSFSHILPFVSIPSSQFWHIWEQEPGINHVWVFCSNLAGAQIMLVLLMSSHYYTVLSILNSHFKNLSTTLTHCINFPCLGHFVHLIFRTTQFLVFHYSSRP